MKMYFLCWSDTISQTVSHNMYHPQFIQHIISHMNSNHLSLLMKLLKFTFLEKSTMAKWSNTGKAAPRQEAQPHQDPLTQPSNKLAEFFNYGWLKC